MCKLSLCRAKCIIKIHYLVGTEKRVSRIFLKRHANSKCPNGTPQVRPNGHVVFPLGKELALLQSHAKQLLLILHGANRQARNHPHKAFKLSLANPLGHLFGNYLAIIWGSRFFKTRIFIGI